MDEPMPDGTTSDGCTAWPEGDWHHCCVLHDLAYRTANAPSFWSGWWQRRKADLQLWWCVTKSGHPLVGLVMFLGVESFGWIPYHHHVRRFAHWLGSRARRRHDGV